MRGVPAANMIGEPGEGWALAMTVVSHEREPAELGYVARYSKSVKQLEALVRDDPSSYGADQVATLERAFVESEMLRLHVRRRLSERLDGVTHGSDGSIDKLLMTATEQAVGHAALAVGNSTPVLDADDTWLKVYLYSRAQSVMGGTAQIREEHHRHEDPGSPDGMSRPRACDGGHANDDRAIALAVAKVIFSPAFRRRP